MIVRNVLVALFFVLMSAGFAQATVDVYIGDLNLYASKSFSNFKAELSARYGMSGSRFDLMLKKVDSPGDLAVALWIGQKSLKSIDEVVNKFRLHRGRGWGVVAKEMGIKPGSPDFKTLKDGKIDWRPKDFDEVVKKDVKKDKEVKETERDRKKREAHERKEKKRQERDKNKGY